jgi:hypothetical protein
MWSVVPAIYSVISALHIEASIFKWTYLRWYWRYVDNSMRFVLQSLCQIPDYAIWTVGPNIYNVLTDPHIQDSIFSWTYLRCYWRYIDNSASVILQPSCQYCAHPPEYAMWTVVSAMYSIITAPHIPATIFNWMYLRCHCWYIDNSMCVILQTWFEIQRTSSTLRYLNCGPGHIQWTYSSTYSGWNIQLHVSALLLEISRQFNERYTENLVPITAHNHQLTQCELWCRTYTMYLQLRIFSL